jgi:ATP-binding cassette, subfamily B, bacterial
VSRPPRPKNGAGALARRLLLQARPYWRHLAGIVALDLAAVPLALLAPLPLKIAIDSALGGRPLPAPLDRLGDAGATALGMTTALAVAVGGVLAIALASELQKFLTWLLQSWTGEKLVLDFRARLFGHVQRLSLAYHDRLGTADALFRVQYDAPAIQWIGVYGVSPFLTAGLTLAGMIFVTASIDGALALVALAVVPVLALLIRAFGARLHAKWHEAKELGSSATSVLQEVLTSLRVVKAFGQEHREERRFVDQASQELRANVALVRMQGTFYTLVGLTLAAGTAAALWLGVSHVQAGRLTLGELVIVMAYLAQLYTPIEALSKNLSNLQRSVVGAERAFALLDVLPEVADRPDARPLQRARGDIEFRGVAFAYDGVHPVLHDLSLRVPAGTRVGIVGRTGAGKTTLINLVTRFYDPSAGGVLLDGEDLRRWRLEDLRRQFAIVLQEPVLFSTSIAENIAYGRAGAREDEIEAAARAAGAHEFVAALPEGYRTGVGERGMRLSGGERQRIALARAFLKNAPVLILDEPTSSVDTKTEQGIIEALERLMHGRTTFIIAHRLSTLAHCDVVYAVENGRLAPASPERSGPLLANRGLASGAPVAH